MNIKKKSCGRIKSSKNLFNWKIAPWDMLWYRISLIVYLILPKENWKRQRSKLKLWQKIGFDIIRDTLRTILRYVWNVICEKWKTSCKMMENKFKKSKISLENEGKQNDDDDNRAIRAYLCAFIIALMSFHSWSLLSLFNWKNNFTSC